MRGVRKLHEFDRRVARGAAVGVEEEEQSPQVLLVLQEVSDPPAGGLRPAQLGWCFPGEELGHGQYQPLG